MSASSKKKLRQEQSAANLTEKQRKDLQEQKKLKRNTIGFVIIMALIVVLVAAITLRSPVENLIASNRTAVTIGEHKLSTQDFNYFYYDSINSYMNKAYNQFSSLGNYWQLGLGFDISKPLNEQVKDTATGQTWANYFVEEAKKSAIGVYALVDQAKAEGYALSDEENKSINSYFSSMETAVKAQNMSLTEYLRGQYGATATKGSFKEYYRLSRLASAFYTSHSDSLKYEDKDFREYEKDKFNDFSSFSYASYPISVSAYLTGGTKGEDGKTTYSDEEKAAALEAAKKDAEALAALEKPSVEDFNKAIKALEINKSKENAACTETKDTMYTGISNEDIQKWLAEDGRAEGDVKSFETKTSKTNDDGSTTEEITGYTVVVFQSRNDNTMKLVNVRHILVEFSGGTTDQTTQQTVYSDAEKTAAKEKAQAILDEWRNGAATEDSFAALAKEKTEDPGSKENGGLYEDVFPGQMVDAFNDWCFDESRKVGDSGLVETSYGWHIMYFSGYGEMTYRDYMINANLISEEMERWSTELENKMTASEVNTKGMELDYIVNSGNN